MVSSEDRSGRRLSIRDQLVFRAWQNRDASIAELKHLANEFPAGAVRRSIEELIDEWMQCETLDNLKHHPRLLEWIACFVETGTPQSRQRVQRLLQRQVTKQEHRRQVRQMFAYPIVLLMVSIAVLLIYCFAVVPQFDQMFQEFGLKLPASTKSLLALSRLLTGLGGVKVGGLVVLMLGLAWWLKRLFRGSYEDRLRGTHFLSRLPSGCRTIDAFHDLRDFQEVGLQESDAIAVTRDRLRGSFYHANDTTHSKILTPGNAFSQTEPLRELLEIRGGELDRSQASLSSELALAWANIYENRVVNRPRGNWLVLFDFGVKAAVASAIYFMVGALFGPLVTLIEGLT